MTPVRSNNSKGQMEGRKVTGHNTLTGLKGSIINVQFCSQISIPLEVPV